MDIYETITGTISLAGFIVAALSFVTLLCNGVIWFVTSLPGRVDGFSAIASRDLIILTFALFISLAVGIIFALLSDVNY